MLDARANLWWVVQVCGLYFSQFVSEVVENLPLPQLAWHSIIDCLSEHL